MTPEEPTPPQPAGARGGARHPDYPEANKLATRGRAALAALEAQAR